MRPLLLLTLEYEAIAFVRCGISATLKSPGVDNPKVMWSMSGLDLRRLELVGYQVQEALQRRDFVSEIRHQSRRLGVALVLSLAAAGGGCAGGGGAPGASLPAGSTCVSIKAQLSRLDAKGVRGAIEAQSAGERLSPSRKADADSYNSLLNDYLKARCHEVKT